ncbi:MAG: MmgE/PrpD family protein [Proteobacteria bacterium]|nr:MmgE/PrpD family protein [Pseudomonadota bacterium]
MEAAAHDHAARVVAEVAYEVACLALMDSLACAFTALQDPACTQLLGSLVPGATMAFGARVPGTSYQLDPVHAAFNFGTMVNWRQANDPALATTSGHLADNLGAILAVADYRARKAIAEGGSPPLVRDLFATLIQAHELASLEWARSCQGNEDESATGGTPTSASAASRVALTRIASAACSVTLLGGTPNQVAAAIAIARSEMPATEHPGTVFNLDGHEHWRIGDATSRGVRLALIALAGQKVPLTPAPHGNEATMQLAVLAELEHTWRAVAATPTVADRIRDRFAACVASSLPNGAGRQAGRNLPGPD